MLNLPGELVHPIAVTTDFSQFQVLVVDLDNSLLVSDVLLEQIYRLAKNQPLLLGILPWWLKNGKIHLKKCLAERVALQYDRLPWRQEIIELISSARKAGCEVLLASASHVQVVEDIANHLGVFDRWLGSSEQNLHGEAKLKVIRAYIKDRSFAYVGDSAVDLPIWRASSVAIAVNPQSAVLEELHTYGNCVRVVRDRPSIARLLIKELRLHQWVKNLLVFVPLVAGHVFTEPHVWWSALLSFIGFSLTASTVYLGNDLLDLESDRGHPSKKYRPFASGMLPLSYGFILVPLLLGMVSGVACFLPPLFSVWLVVYLGLNILYSWKLKEIILADTIILAIFYTVRVLAGGAAMNIPTSPWLLAFAIFFFFGLAMIKRYTELAGSTKVSLDGRGYERGDLEAVFTFGVTSSFLCPLVLVLYLNSSDVSKLYRQPHYLWLVTPVALYWISRAWLLARRQKIDDDPVLFALRDRISWAMLVALTLIFMVAI